MYFVGLKIDIIHSTFKMSLETLLWVNLNIGLIWTILSLISMFRILYWCWKTQSINFKNWLVKVCYRWRHMYDQCIYATVGYLMSRSDAHITFSVHSWCKYCVKDTNCQYFRCDHGNEVKWLAAKGAKFIWNGSTLNCTVLTANWASYWGSIIQLTVYGN